GEGYWGTSAGVRKRVEGGGAWTARGTGVGRRDVRALVIDPQTPAILYAGVGGGRPGSPGAVFKTTNGGANWRDTGLATPEVRALAIDPETPSTVYVGALSTVFRTSDGGV